MWRGRQQHCRFVHSIASLITFLTYHVLGKRVFKTNFTFSFFMKYNSNGCRQNKVYILKNYGGMIVIIKGNKETSTFSIMHPQALSGPYILTLGSIRGLIWCCNFFFVSFFSDFLVSAWESAAVISFWRSCCFFSRSFFLASIFFSSFIRVCSSSICQNNETIKILKYRQHIKIL